MHSRFSFERLQIWAETMGHPGIQCYPVYITLGVFTDLLLLGNRPQTVSLSSQLTVVNDNRLKRVLLCKLTKQLIIIKCLQKQNCETFIEELKIWKSSSPNENLNTLADLSGETDIDISAFNQREISLSIITKLISRTTFNKSYQRSNKVYKV